MPQKYETITKTTQKYSQFPKEARRKILRKHMSEKLTETHSISKYRDFLSFMVSDILILAVITRGT